MFAHKNCIKVHKKEKSLVNHRLSAKPMGKKLLRAASIYFHPEVVCGEEN